MPKGAARVLSIVAAKEKLQRSSEECIAQLRFKGESPEPSFLASQSVLRLVYVSSNSGVEVMPLEFRRVEE